MRLLKYIGVILFAILFHLYLYHLIILQNLDYKIFDFFMNHTKHTLPHSAHSVVIDIDEKSLQKYGQWPWPRIVNAKLIGQLSLMHPSAIGVNIIFPEKDRTSPINIQSFYKDFFNYEIEMPRLPVGLKDNDLILLESILESKSTLSIYLSDDKESLERCSLLTSPYTFEEIHPLLNATTALCNNPFLQKHLKRFGFINVKADSDGVFRRMPLFMSYKKMMIPSLGIATLLDDNGSNLTIDKERNLLFINTHKIHPNKNYSVILNFNTASIEVISAIEILENRVPKEFIEGKVVLIGSSSTRLGKEEFLSRENKVSNSLIHATLIDNVLNHQLYTQPEMYKNINILLSLLVSLLMVYCLYKRWFIAISLLFFLIMSFSSVWNSIFIYNHIYISIGYLWIPFLLFSFIMSSSFILLYVKEQKHSKNALLESHVAMVESMILLATIHDDETGGHILRTKNYVKILAEYFYRKGKYSECLTVNSINLMYEAAPLHDIGKIGIPDAILKKPAKLTYEEFEVMKTHSTIGKNVIQNMLNAYDKNNFLKVAYNIAFYHHEKWDGTGYPKGLKGDEIPIEAQFMTLADVYDALISKRCYKKAFSFEEAEKIILSGKGKVYSPELIEAFIALKEEFKKIALRYQD